MVLPKLEGEPVALIAGGVLGLAMLTYALFPAPTEKSSAQIRVVPVITASDGGLVITGRF